MVLSIPRALNIYIIHYYELKSHGHKDNQNDVRVCMTPGHDHSPTISRKSLHRQITQFCGIGIMALGMKVVKLEFPFVHVFSSLKRKNLVILSESANSYDPTLPNKN
ncbi:2935_t:CDS:2, partial [Scutellospora calospora]